MPVNNYNEIPQEYRERLIKAAVTFRTKYPEVQHDDMVELLMDVVTIVTDFMEDKEDEI